MKLYWIMATRCRTLCCHFNRSAVQETEYREPEEFEGRGVYYGATYIEAQLCENEDVVVIGGANSAGQAAVYLAQTARKVYMLVRSELSETMSRYLIHRITGNPQIELHQHTEIAGMEGNGELKRVTWNDGTPVKLRPGTSSTCLS